MGAGEPRKYDFIDALRGFAILGVVLIHTQDWILPKSTYLAFVVNQGARGVQLFFIASALTIFLSMNGRARGESAPIRNFFIRRFFRIAPLFYVAILFYMLIGSIGREYWAPNGIQWWFVPLTALFLHGWHPETITSVVPGSWSIAVEMMFYLIAPLLFVKLTNIKSTSIFLVACLLVARISSEIVHGLIAPHYPESQEYLVDNFFSLWFFEQVSIFVLGILTYHVFVKYQGRRDMETGSLLLGLSIFLFLAFSTTSTFNQLLPNHFLVGIGFCVFALALHFYPNMLFVNPVTIWIGKLSFGIYLIHFAIINFCRQIWGESIGFGGNVSFVMAFAIVLLLSIGAAFVLHRVIERPGIEIGRELIKRLEQPQTHRVPQVAPTAKTI